MTKKIKKLDLMEYEYFDKDRHAKILPTEILWSVGEMLKMLESKINEIIERINNDKT